jgi:hypothetical protein
MLVAVPGVRRSIAEIGATNVVVALARLSVERGPGQPDIAGKPTREDFGC